MASNAVPPSVTSPSPFEWPNTVQSISGITNDKMAIVHCVGHGFNSADESITSLMFQQVKGMLPINGLPAVIQKVVDDDHFIVNIDTTQFPIYRGSGIVSILTGEPPVEKQSFQYFNTPFQNIATSY